MNSDFETNILYSTRKLHISIPLNVYEFLRTQKLFKEIDGVITELLIKKYQIE